MNTSPRQELLDFWAKRTISDAMRHGEAEVHSPPFEAGPVVEADRVAGFLGFCGWSILPWALIVWLLRNL